MVFHYTNFIYETNFWWMRRVRPVWVTGAVAFGLFIFYRYYFFGKNAVLARNRESKEVWEQRAQKDKRNWGYDPVYKPTLERSRKKLILETLGDKYDYPVHATERGLTTYKDLEQILDEQNDY